MIILLFKGINLTYNFQFIEQQQKQQNMDGAGIQIPEMYKVINKLNTKGIEGYDFEKKYCDPLKQVQEREYAKIKKGTKTRKHVTKRGNYLDDEAKMHKLAPGPGHYICKTEWSEKTKSHVKPVDRRTVFAEIMRKEKRQKKPAPGQYNVVKTLKEQAEENKRLASKKVSQKDRTTYLDGIQYEASTLPGVGTYNPRVRAKTESTLSVMQPKPEEWRKKHAAQSVKKPCKTPDMTTYHPVPSTYSLFENVAKTKPNKNLLGKIDRFKTQSSGSGLNPAKYNVIQEWRGKEEGKNKKERHGLEVLAKTVSRSVYYH